VMDYNHYMGYVDKGDQMANSYISWHTIKRTKKFVLSAFRPTATFFIPCGGEFHIEIFNLPSLGIYWYMLDKWRLLRWIGTQHNVQSHYHHYDPENKRQSMETFFMDRMNEWIERQKTCGHKWRQC
jgi:isoleucyl-tRNA synthetase